MATANNQLYSSGIFNPVIDDCDGCDRIVEFESKKYCKTYSAPAAKWKLGICNFATHKKPEIISVKIRVNPIKASKRASGKGK